MRGVTLKKGGTLSHTPGHTSGNISGNILGTPQVTPKITLQDATLNTRNYWQDV